MSESVTPDEVVEAIDSDPEDTGAAETQEATNTDSEEDE